MLERQAFPAGRRQVLVHLGRGILIGTTYSLTAASAEKHGEAVEGRLRGSERCHTDSH